MMTAALPHKHTEACVYSRHPLPPLNSGGVGKGIVCITRECPAESDILCLILHSSMSQGKKHCLSSPTLDTSSALYLLTQSILRVQIARRTTHIRHYCELGWRTLAWLCKRNWHRWESDSLVWNNYTLRKSTSKNCIFYKKQCVYNNTNTGQ